LQALFPLFFFSFPNRQLSSLEKPVGHSELKNYRFFFFFSFSSFPPFLPIALQADF